MDPIEEVLHKRGHRNDEGRWWFSDPRVTHSEAQALQIAEACMLLDLPVDDTLTSAAWLTLVRKVAELARAGQPSPTDALSAEQATTYGFVCPLYPGDVVAFHPAVDGIDPSREWVVKYDRYSHWPVVGVMPLWLTRPLPEGGTEQTHVASRSMVRLVRPAVRR